MRNCKIIVQFVVICVFLFLLLPAFAAEKSSVFQDKQPAGNLPGEIVDIDQAAGEVERPEYVLNAYRYLSGFLDYGRYSVGAGYSFDMHNPEGSQGHIALTSQVNKMFESIEGYSDPNGFVDPNGFYLEKISLKDFPYIEKMRNVIVSYALPSGQLNPLGDSIAGQITLPLEQSKNVMLAGYGHAVLGSGKGINQSQIQLSFSEQGADNSHSDCLSIVWYAHQREMSGEIGGRRNKLRGWSCHALTHNTVLIDRQNQSGGDTFGNVLLYISDIDGLSVLQVDGAKAYRHIPAGKYRRTIIHNTLDSSIPYFVDIFEVEGGSTHDYSIHGSVFGDMTGVCSLPVTSVAGERPLLEEDEKWIEPGGLDTSFSFPSSKYGLIGKVKKAKASRNFHVKFAYKDDQATGTCIHMPADISMDVFLGRSPALRPAGHYNDADVYSWKMPHLIARRTGQKPLKSTFIAVYDMFRDGKKIKSVNRMVSSDAYISLEITLNDRTDKLLYSPDGRRFMVGGGIQMKGRLGLLTEKNGTAQAYLVDGTILRKTPLMIRSKSPSYTGRILTASRKGAGRNSNSFTVDTLLPTGTSLRGKWMIVFHPMSEPVTADIKNAKRQIVQHPVTHAYEIDFVERKGVKMIVHLKEDHGLEIEGGKTREVFSQWKVFTGPNRFAIYNHCQSKPVLTY